jgi:hypothetical protein
VNVEAKCWARVVEGRRGGSRRDTSNWSKERGSPAASPSQRRVLHRASSNHAVARRSHVWGRVNCAWREVH